MKYKYWSILFVFGFYFNHHLCSQIVVEPRIGIVKDFVRSQSSNERYSIVEEGRPLALNADISARMRNNSGIEPGILLGYNRFDADIVDFTATDYSEFGVSSTIVKCRLLADFTHNEKLGIRIGAGLNRYLSTEIKYFSGWTGEGVFPAPGYFSKYSFEGDIAIYYQLNSFRLYADYQRSIVDRHGIDNYSFIKNIRLHSVSLMIGYTIR